MKKLMVFLKTYIKRISVITLLFSYSFLLPMNDAIVQDELLKKIFTDHVSQLQYTQVQHPPFVITLSGTPGMGKSFVAQHLEEKYQAVRLSTDELRMLIKSKNLLTHHNFESFFENYCNYFLSHYTGANKRIIIDASIDRRYKLLFPLLQKKEIPFCVIRLEVSRERVIERIKNREQEAAPNYLKYLEKWFQDYEQFGHEYSDFILFDNNNDAYPEQLTIPQLDC